MKYVVCERCGVRCERYEEQGAQKMKMWSLTTPSLKHRGVELNNMLPS